MDAASCKPSDSKEWSLPLVKVRNTFIEPDEGGNASPRSTHSDPTGRVSKPAPVSVKLPESWKRKGEHHSRQAETSFDTKDSAASQALFEEDLESTRDAGRITSRKTCAQGLQGAFSQMLCTEIAEKSTEGGCARKASVHGGTLHLSSADDTLNVLTLDVEELAEAPHKDMCGRIVAKAPNMEPKHAEKADSQTRSQKASRFLTIREPSVTLSVDIPGVNAFREFAVAGSSPSFGSLHSFHSDARSSGHLSADSRDFMKTAFEGRLTVLSERRLLAAGQQTYLVMFTHGELSPADGVGFVFSHYLPCPKNIQKITSIFVNQRGQICLRMQSEVVRFSICTKPLQVGDLIGLKVDMEARQICFVVWPAHGGPPAPAIINFGIYQETKKGSRFSKDMPGHFACVVKNVGMTLRLLS